MKDFLTSEAAQIAVYVLLSLGVGLLGVIVKWAHDTGKLKQGSLAAEILDYTVASLTQVATAKIAEGMSKDQAVAHAVTLISPTTQAAMAVRNTSEDVIAQRISGALTMAGPIVTSVVAKAAA